MIFINFFFKFSFYYNFSIKITFIILFSTPRAEQPDIFHRNPLYGVGDLNPLGGLQGGGMYFDPLRVQGGRVGRMPRYSYFY